MHRITVAEHTWLHCPNSKLQVPQSNLPRVESKVPVFVCWRDMEAVPAGRRRLSMRVYLCVCSCVHTCRLTCNPCSQVEVGPPLSREGIRTQAHTGARVHGHAASQAHTLLAQFITCACKRRKVPLPSPCAEAPNLLHGLQLSLQCST
jgi:hypothetical protein